MDAGRKFASKDQEADHWRNLAQQYKQELEETKEELEDYQISSRELEQELETQLKQEEKKNKELNLANDRLQNECDSLRDKLQKLQGDSHKRVTELEDNLAKVEAYKNELAKYVRELEQANDDLERAKRATVVSLEDFEHRLNEAIERNAFLESELDEKGTLVDTVQRLKDEARDLKSEIDVKKHQDVVMKTSSESLPGVSAGQPMQDSGYAAQGTTPTTPTTPMGRIPPSGITNNSTGGTPLTPSARISALNIVGDLLRKVGALESKLATCRNFVKDDSRAKTGTSPLNSPRTKRLNRGSSLPVQQGVKMSV
ncbi:nuclear distribution protein nudE homolog 1 isoform X3 [Aplysia californica]|uniref:Nuclear distribution protein nudE homolog 1 isoform X3 n=1 Tax=Aplysia californica TaxID=6500 RepID=A0ABM0JLM5_APLCA|nr:nuclear distribution protein nudE homolog 1 isoform X3 [Aplysia californica]